MPIFNSTKQIKDELSNVISYAMTSQSIGSDPRISWVCGFLSSLNFLNKLNSWSIEDNKVKVEFKNGTKKELEF